MSNFIPKFILDNFSKKKHSGEFKAIVLFIDISGFTKLTEKLMQNGKEGVEILSNTINDLFSYPIKQIYNNGGFISTFAGDAFNALFLNMQKKISVLDIALDIIHKFKKNGLYETKFGNFKLSAKIGISFGDVNWGIVIGKTQNSYFFKGNAIDNAAFCEHQAKKSEIFFDKNLKTYIKDKNILYEKTNKYYKLKNHTLKKRSPISAINSQNIISVKNSNTNIKNFVPEAVTKLESKGEFREIISCFITLKNDMDIFDVIPQIINLTNDYGGYFNKIDFGDKGNIILVLFGAPIARETIFYRMANYILSVISIDKNSIKAGITTGISFAGFIGSKERSEYTAIGQIVNLSSRFMTEANYGEIYIDKKIHKELENDFKSYILDSIYLKGFQGKITPCKLIGKKRKNIAEINTGIFVGRKKEKEIIKTYFDNISNGKYQQKIFFVDGQGGIGKSRIVSEVKKELHLKDNNLNWILMVCDDILKKSYNPITYFLRSFFYIDDTINTNFDKEIDTEIKKRIKNKKYREIFGTIKTAIKFLAGLKTDLWFYNEFSPKERYEYLKNAFKTFVELPMFESPLIIQIEDIHLIDNDSFNLIKYILNNTQNIYIIATCRTNDNDSVFNFNLGNIPFERISIPNLNEKASNKLIITEFENISAKKNIIIPEKTLNYIMKKSEGNPFFINQIILYMTEKKIVAKNYKMTKNNFNIPSSINTIIISRIDRLTTDVKNTIKAASVLGKEFSIDILKTMIKKGSLNKSLMIGKTELIWDSLSEIEYIFKHIMIRDSIYEMQLKSNLRILHNLAGNSIEDIYVNNISNYFADLATHFEKAEITKKAYKYLKLAADQAKYNYQNESALDFYERLLKFVTDKKEMVEILTTRGELLNFTGKIQDSFDCFNKTLHLAQKENFMLETSLLQRYIGNYYLRNGKLQEAIALYEKALKISMKINDKLGMCNLYGNIGLIYLNTGENNSAYKYFEKRLNIALELKNKEELIKSYNFIGNYYNLKNDYIHALNYYKKQLKMAKTLKNKKLISIAFSNIGIVKQKLGKHKKAIEIFKKKLNLSLEIGDMLEVCRALGNIGVIYYHTANYETALEYYFKKLKYVINLRNMIELATVYGNIGDIYFDKGAYKTALKYYKNQTISAENSHSKIYIADAAGNMGIIYMINKKYDKALIEFNKKLDIAKQIDDKLQISIALTNIGNLYFEKGDYNSANKTYRKQLKLSKEINDLEGVSYALSNIGYIYLNLGNYDTAIKFYEEKIKISNQLNDKKELIIAFGSMGDCYKNKELYNKATKYYKQAIQIAKDIGINGILVNLLYNFAELEFIVSNISKSKEIIKEAFSLSKYGDEEDIFNLKLLKLKIKGVKNKNKVITDYIKLLNLHDSDSKKASILFELFELTKILEYKKISLKIYKRLYKKTPNIQYKNRINILKNIR